MCLVTSEYPYRVAVACALLGPLAGARLHFLTAEPPMRGGCLDVEDPRIRGQLARVRDQADQLGPGVQAWIP